MRDQAAKELSIIVVNWNSKEYVLRSIESILANTSGIEYEVIVVDSGSFDGCGLMLQRMYPEVRFIQSDVNLGFGRASNLGAGYARGSLLLFLNPDTEVLEGSIERLCGTMPVLAEVGVLGCRLLNGDGSLQTSCVQSFPTILNQTLDTDVLRRVFPRSKLFGMAALYARGGLAREVEAISGACMMIQRKTFERVGGFRPDYFMYGEDIDLCFRIRGIGLHNYHVGDAVVVHHGGGSTRHTVSRFSTVMKVESVGRFLRGVRGGGYSVCYRVSLSGMAVIRLALLSLFLPGRWLFWTRDEWKGGIQKWVFVLRWGLGLEGWTRRYGLGDSVGGGSNDPVGRSCVGSAGN